MSFNLTDANGCELKRARLEEIVEDLTSLKKEEIIAVAASMAIVLFEYNWKEQFQIFQEVLENG
jgi:predicted nuclease with RNAse H fold